MSDYIVVVFWTALAAMFLFTGDSAAVFDCIIVAAVYDSHRRIMHQLQNAEDRQ